MIFFSTESLQVSSVHKRVLQGLYKWAGKFWTLWCTKGQTEHHEQLWGKGFYLYPYQSSILWVNVLYTCILSIYHNMNLDVFNRRFFLMNWALMRASSRLWESSICVRSRLCSTVTVEEAVWTVTRLSWWSIQWEKTWTSVIITTMPKSLWMYRWGKSLRRETCSLEIWDRWFELQFAIDVIMILMIRQWFGKNKGNCFGPWMFCL